MAAGYYKRKDRWVRRRKEAVVRIFPCFDRGGPRRETFFQQQLMMQCNWRDLNDLNPENESWEVVYNRRFGVQATPDNVDDDVSSVSSEDSNHSSQERDEWMDLSNMGPEAHFTAREPGTREFDTSFEWTDSYRNYPGILEIGSFLGNCKRDHLQSQSDLSASSMQFSEEQENILRLLDAQIENSTSTLLQPQPDLIKRLIVQGSAGTGKSTVIGEMTRRLRENLGNSSFILMAPTGVAAYNIGGKTIHSALRIPTSKKNFTSLSPVAEREFQNEFASCKFIIVDEFSMIGCSLMNMMDKRMRQAKPEFSHEPFGNVFVYLFGDLMQLPPVMDRQLYSHVSSNNPSANEGHLAYRTFQHCQILSINQRQAGQCAEQEIFRGILNRISRGLSTQEDWCKLSSRFEMAVLVEDRQTFDSAVQLEPTREKVKLNNLTKLMRLHQPIAKIAARNS